LLQPGKWKAYEKAKFQTRYSKIIGLLLRIFFKAFFEDFLLFHHCLCPIGEEPHDSQCFNALFIHPSTVLFPVSPDSLDKASVPYSSVVEKPDFFIGCTHSAFAIPSPKPHFVKTY